MEGDLRRRGCGDTLLSWGFDGVGSRLKMVGFLGVIDGFKGFEREATEN